MTERGARAVKVGENDYRYHFACHLKKSEEQRYIRAARSGIALEQKKPRPEGQKNVEKARKNTLLIYRAPPGRSQAFLDAVFCENRLKPLPFVIFSCHFRDFFRYVISRIFAP